MHNELHPEIDLRKPENLNTVVNTLQFWELKRIENIAWCIMPNHIHWIIYLKEKNLEGKIILMQEILHSVKLFTARNMNTLEKRNGSLWGKECFDTTVRNELHFTNVINYTLHNPVKAGFVKNWKGNFISEKHLDVVED